jgi:hypothetical protein
LGALAAGYARGTRADAASSNPPGVVRTGATQPRFGGADRNVEQPRHFAGRGLGDLEQEQNRPQSVVHFVQDRAHLLEALSALDPLVAIGSRGREIVELGVGHLRSAPLTAPHVTRFAPSYGQKECPLRTSMDPVTAM